MNFDGKKVLLISAHTDDLEVAIGGFVLSQKDKSLWKHLVFSPAKESIPEGFPVSATEREFIESQRFMGIKEYRMENFDVRWFPESRQKILEVLNEEKRDFKPDVIFCPSSVDIHQDHATVGKEVYRAFYGRTIYEYLSSKSFGEERVNTFIEIDEDTFKLKQKLIGIYKSQLAKFDFKALNENIMKFCGERYIGKGKYAETMIMRKKVERIS